MGGVRGGGRADVPGAVHFRQSVTKDTFRQYRILGKGGFGEVRPWGEVWGVMVGWWGLTPPLSPPPRCAPAKCGPRGRCTPARSWRRSGSRSGKGR